MNNMNWIKTPLEPTDSFMIKSGLQGGEYFIDSISESVVATPELIPGVITFITPEMERSSNQVSKKVNFTITVEFTSNSISPNGDLLLTLPDDVIYDMGFDLTTLLMSNNSMEVDNTKTLYSSGAIKTIWFKSV